ncbi:MAG: hypothetical protein BWY65_02296 [Firmicutes bacterium ADurb.Bin373]|nr:MAG: hypothetical protein BWY65_02296 [Firmicutes bacterium ADurb.Bin373]
MLIDPVTAPLRTSPREERDLALSASNSWALCFDNLSGMPAWLSDALCRVATGGGFSTRTLYTDSEEAIFDYMRPVTVNGIDDVVARHDLLDRALVLTLPVIPDNKRKDEARFWKDFEKARPGIFGALLDAMVTGLKNIHSVKLKSLPRMADFAKWVTAAEPALPWQPGEFMAAYTGNRGEAVEAALENDIVAVAVQALLKKGEWLGTATALLSALRGHIPEHTQKTKAWPKTARVLSGRLRRAATFLRCVGIEIEFGNREPGTGKRLVRISRDFTVTTVTTVTEKAVGHVAQGFKGVTQSVAQNEGVTQTPSHVTQSVTIPSQLEASNSAGCDQCDDSDDEKHTFSIFDENIVFDASDIPF